MSDETTRMKERKKTVFNTWTNQTQQLQLQQQQPGLCECVCVDTVCLLGVGRTDWAHSQRGWSTQVQPSNHCLGAPQQERTVFTIHSTTVIESVITTERDNAITEQQTAWTIEPVERRRVQDTHRGTLSVWVLLQHSSDTFHCSSVLVTDTANYLDMSRCHQQVCNKSL